MADEDLAERERIFKIFDTNGDGKISGAEVAEAMKKHGHDNPDEIKRMMNQIDTDGDGFISFQEFTAFYRDNKDSMKLFK